MPSSAPRNSDMKVLVEICCDGIESARTAASMGAGRIELCSSLGVGGLTPPHSEIAAAAALDTPVNVLVRPREGDFVYSVAEAERMARDISCCGIAGVAGVVIGALDRKGNVDLPLCRDLVAIARSYGLSVTFHRAIDASSGIMKALDDVILLGADRVLTSGGAVSAFEGRMTIARMVEAAAGRCVVMPGCGITKENAGAIIDCTGAGEIHGSRLSLLTL